MTRISSSSPTHMNGTDAVHEAALPMTNGKTNGKFLINTLNKQKSVIGRWKVFSFKSFAILIFGFDWTDNILYWNNNIYNLFLINFFI